MIVSAIRSRLSPRTALAVGLVGALALGGAVAWRKGADAQPLVRLSALPTSGLVADLGCAIRHSPREVGCFGKVRATLSPQGVVSPLVTSGPVGYGPSDIQSAYRLRGLNAKGRTVAIVDPYDNPKAESDLAVYRSTFGLPPCTTANGCFRKVNQLGAKSPLPARDVGWAQEISLDLDMVSAACPSCHIVLVEANSARDVDIARAERTATGLPGVVAVSNSFGAPEDSTILGFDSAFKRAGVAVTASSGDNGFGVSWPASSRHVVAVGGTKLTRAANARGWSETAWSGAGSGCSKFEPKPRWQTDTGCVRRSVSDLSAVADPTTGVAVYSTANSCSGSPLCGLLLSLGGASGSNGWLQVGGTSVGSPIIASMYALAGRTKTFSPENLYRHTSSFFDVTSGSNGYCGRSYLCTARRGYDGPTGLGTPNGVGGL